MYQANLSYAQLQRYLDYLVKVSLLEMKNVNEEDLYVATEKGLDLIEKFKKLTSIIE